MTRGLVHGGVLEHAVARAVELDLEPRSVVADRPVPRTRTAATLCVLLAWVVVATASGCASAPYQPGSFAIGSAAFEGTYAELGCLDVAVTATTPPRGADAALVLTYGNRCEDVVTIDLESMHPRGLDVRGHDVPLRFVDDRPGLRPLDRRLVGREILALRRDPGASPESELSTICVELGALEQRAARSDRICVATPGDR